MNSQYMKRAIELSKKGYGYVNPNPIVGAVIVEKDEIIGEGYHRKYGENHAEVNAIEDALTRGNGTRLENSQMYVTLEPCCHWGKTPPCTEAIIKHGIKCVYIGCEDTNPLVKGGGVAKLKEHGIDVQVGICQEEVRESNEIFFHNQEKKRPFVILKSASSLDGKIATTSGESKWITSRESREEVHRIRQRVMGIMVGVNTVVADNPTLDVRLDDVKKVNPIRIILDSKGRTPIQSNVLRCHEQETIIVMAAGVSSEKKKEYSDNGVVVIEVPSVKGKLDLKAVLDKLREFHIDSVLIEGGGEVHFSALEQGVVDKVMMFLAPKIFGGRDAKTSVEGNGFETIQEAVKLKSFQVRRVGADLLVEGRIEKE